MRKSVIVGIIERLRNAKTSLVFSFDPRRLRRRSKKTFERLRAIRNTRIASRTRLRLMIPKKKIEFTKGSVLEAFDRLSAAFVQRIIAMKTIAIVHCSRRRLRFSVFSRG